MSPSRILPSPPPSLPSPQVPFFLCSIYALIFCCSNAYAKKRYNSNLAHLEARYLPPLMNSSKMSYSAMSKKGVKGVKGVKGATGGAAGGRGREEKSDGSTVLSPVLSTVLGVKSVVKSVVVGGGRETEGGREGDAEDEEGDVTYVNSDYASEDDDEDEDDDDGVIAAERLRVLGSTLGLGLGLG